MKKFLLLVLLGLGVAAINTDNFTSKVTEFLVSGSSPRDADQQLQNRLAALEKIRESNKRTAPDDAVTAETFDQTRSVAAPENMAASTSTIAWNDQQTSGSALTPENPRQPDSLSKKSGQAAPAPATTSTQAGAESPRNDDGSHGADIPTPVAQISVTQTEQTPDKAIDNAGNKARSDSTQKTTVAQAGNIEGNDAANPETSNAYAHAESLGIAESSKPTLEYQWSRKERRFVMIGDNDESERSVKRAPSRKAALPDDGIKVVKVQPGDSLTRIARRMYGDASKYRAIYMANRDAIKNVEYIYPGQTLKIPDAATMVASVTAAAESLAGVVDPVAPLITITVQKGDTLSKIALRYLGNIKAYKQLFEINRAELTDPNVISPGQKIQIPVYKHYKSIAAAAPQATENATQQSIELGSDDKTEQSP